MAQVRREPRFVEMEVLAPVRAPGVGHSHLQDADITDAVFESIRAPFSPPPEHSAPRAASAVLPGISLLKQSVPFDAVSYARGDSLSPGFLAVTLVLALGVFWLCGGHALLY